ncbi:MAG: AbrB/MazE/SpoVT family DNA-binding domain-containing protein [Chromatiaceae bacterium]|nr:MAG: AbrB/MazE/SpoVT family DNA-binding domain-containing protein [Chromatiaceae bacterium]
MQAPMQTSKGQVSIPATVRKTRGLRPGDRIAGIVEGDAAQLVSIEHRVEVAFGLGQRGRSDGTIASVTPRHRSGLTTTR